MNYNVEYYSLIFTEFKENNCSSIVTQVIIKVTEFSFILLISSSETSTIREAAILKIGASVLKLPPAGDYG